MIKYKELKKNSRKSLKQNYIVTILIALFGIFMLSRFGSTKASLLSFFERVQNYYDNGHFMTNIEINYLESGLGSSVEDFNVLITKTDEELVELGYNEAAINYINSLKNSKFAGTTDANDLDKKLKVRDGIAKPILRFVSSDFNIMFDNIENVVVSILTGNATRYTNYTAIMGIVLLFVYRFFFANVLSVGYARFFLENSKYHKTRYGRIVIPFYSNYIKVVKAMARCTFYQSLWNLTIIGGIIKNYSYKLVPYLIAEDNNISSKQAILLSRKLMNGYKWKAFLLEASFWGWDFLSDITLGLSGIFYSNAYAEGTYAEFYKAIIKERKNEDFMKEALNGREYFDEDLYIEEDSDYYKGTKPSPNNYVIQNYKPLNLLIIFFAFAFAGWIMECSLFLLKTHVFVNRGTMIGPWVPIYGIGCVIIILFFTKTNQKKHMINPAVVMVEIMVLCGALEYFSSWLLETTTGLKYWDYSGHFLSINGRICFENLCEFGIGGMLCIYLLAPNINKIIEKSNKKVVRALAIVLIALFLTDFIYVRVHPRTGYGVTDSIIDEDGNVIDKEGNKVS